tara:strand:- start:9128 stop:9514 length:387 start_codon:yes stop_codon:yes gene_type:complete
MKVKYTTKDVRAGTTYVELDRDQKNEILGYLIQWLAHLNEGVRNPKEDLGGFFEAQSVLPKMARGRDNSVTSYIAGILNNQLFRPNAKTGRYQEDFTRDNIEWIQQISIGMNGIAGTPVIEFSESMWN